MQTKEALEAVLLDAQLEDDYENRDSDGRFISKATLLRVQDTLMSMQTRHEFSINELMAIARITYRLYIPYEDYEAHAVLRRIDSILRETDDMARDPSKGTQ